MSETAESRKIRCVVVQLSHLGDVIQSLMALRATKQLYPQMEIHLVVRESYAVVAKRVPWIDQVLPLPVSEIVDPVISGKSTATENLGTVARWVGPLIQKPWDFVINWSYSESSSFLTALLPAHIKLGYTRQGTESLSAWDGWSHYLQGIIQGGIPQNIHIIDILTTQLLTAFQIHLGDPDDAGNSTASSRSFFTLELRSSERSWSKRDSSKKWMSIQIGSELGQSPWNAHHWASFIQEVLKRHSEYGIVLLGEPKDRALAKEVLTLLDTRSRAQAKVLSLVGETDFDLWTTILSQCQWLISPPSAATALASVLGTRTLLLTPHCEDLYSCGPYGNGHYVLAPKSGSSEPPSPRAAFSVWSYAATEWRHRREYRFTEHLEILGTESELDNAKAFRTHIRGSEEGGGVCYTSLLSRPLEMTEWASQVVGYIARAWYCGWVPPLGQELPRQSLSTALIRELRDLSEPTEVLEKVCYEAQETALKLYKKGSTLRSEKIMSLDEQKALKELGQRIEELDKLIERLGKTHPLMEGFSRMSKVLMHNLRGQQIAELGRESAESYQQLKQGVTLLKDWIQHTRDLAKPIAVPLSSVPKEAPHASP